MGIEQVMRSSDSFLGRLRRDVRGNTLAMMAIALIPLCAMAGSAVDTARMYVVKVRLQQACDAGVLAGRKFMTSSNDANLDDVAKQRAQEFFANNFPYKADAQNWMGLTAVEFTPSKTTDQQVSGIAKATVPMTLMKMFRMSDAALEVRCEARFDVADADIMMVLDTTGSMACPSSGGCSTAYSPYTRADGSTGYSATETTNAKIKSLRSAVLDFWDTINSNKDSSTHIRYGFVPYSTTVNVGRIIPATFLVAQNRYASRELFEDANSGSYSTVALSGYNSGNCGTAEGRYPGSDPKVREGWYSNATAYRLYDVAWVSGRCQAKRQNLVPRWRYGWVTYNVANYIAGSTTLADPSKISGNSEPWAGCIEERETVAASSFDQNDLPADLDPDVIPTSDATRWRPAWPDVIYDRNAAGDVYTTSNLTNLGTPNSLKGGLAPCPKQALRLDEMSRSQVESYLSAANDFRPYGNTYHDSGMIWGTRFLAPAGPFASDTAAWPGRNQPNRHIVFMTDGDTVTDNDIYALYGIEISDQRVTGGNVAQLTNRVNARFVAACNAARARNITVWVVAFGTTLNSNMTACATPPFNQHAFFASNETQLRAAFKQIAVQVAKLRISN